MVDRQRLRRWLICLMCVAVAAAFGGVAAAQEDEQQEEAEATPKPVVVKEITVTAQKREQDVQEVPASISTLSGEDLEVLTVGTPDVRILSGRVPSLILESSFGRAFPRFYIRGLGNTDFDLNASQPVSMLVDEVVLENPVVKGMPLWDLDRVEVLRGPQGTLFGRNTPAGVVKFETRKPTREFDAYARASLGTYTTLDVNGAVSGPLSDTVSARFSWLYQSQDDWVDNKYPAGRERELGGYDTTAWRLQFSYEPNERFNALLNLHGWDLDGTARIFRANIITPGQDDLVPGFRQDEVFHDGRNQQEISASGGVLRLEYDFGEATLTSITGYERIGDMYSRGDIDGGFGSALFPPAPPSGPGFIPFASESADGIPDLEQLTQELRLASNSGGSWDWLVGLYYFSEDLSAATYNYDSLTPGNPQAGYATQQQDAEAYALFGSLDFYVSDDWSLKLGLRYSDDQKDFSAERLQPTFANVPTIAPIRRSTDDSSLDWDLTATYKASDTVNYYARVATGFRAPSIQGRILFAPDVEGGTNPATNGVSVADTEEILSFEVGAKTILAGGRLRLNLTAYRYEVDGLQLTAVGGQYNIATLLNADTTEGHGLEADIEWTPSGNWLMTFGASWNPTEIKDPGLAVTACGGGCTVLDPTAPSPFDPFGTIAFIDGNPLPHAPELILNGIVGYRSDPVGKGYFATLDFSYYSEKSFFLYESEEFNGSGFEVGLRLGYAWAQTGYEVALFARNLLDEEIIRGGIDFNNLTGFTNEPRIVGVELIARF